MPQVGHWDWLRRMLAARNLSKPDGRPLFRYRLTDVEYRELKDLLRQLANIGRLESADPQYGAVFAAYCAEWFRRESTSTFLKWESVLPPAEFSVPYAGKLQLTQAGLRYWQRTLRKSSSAREFLLTLALEGGFPVQVLKDGLKGWLKEYLRTIVTRGIILSAESIQEVAALAREEDWRIRQTYRHDDFLTLCSEFAWGLISLRREAENAAIGGIANSIVLDKVHAGWREELPIYFPEGQDEADALLLGLIDQKVGVLSAEGLEARRFLVKRDGRWRPALQVVADGEISASALPLSTDARARAIPAAELGNHLTGELALFEPPLERLAKWRIRPLSRSAKLLLDFPFSATVTVTLTSPLSAPQPWRWPKGEALRSDLLVFLEDEASTQDEVLLRFFRSGSVNTQAKTLYVLFTPDWMIDNSNAEAVIEIEDIPTLGRRLAKITGIAYFRPADSGDGVFRVATGEDQREREFQLKALNPGFDLVDGKCEVVQTATLPMIKEGIRNTREPQIGEVFARRPGERWKALRGLLTGEGRLDLSWRDPKADIQLEKRQLLLLPAGAHVTGTMKTANAAEISLVGMMGWSVSTQMPDCESEFLPCGLSVAFFRRPAYRLPLTLRSPNGDTFAIIVSLKGYHAVLALADGSVVQPNDRIDVGRLRGGIASTPRRQMLEISCRGANWASARILVEGELPLGSMREAVQDMFAVLPNQDDELKASFIGDTRAPIRINRYRYEQLKIDPSQLIHWPGHSQEPTVKAVAKMILDPRHEHALESDTSTFWRLPDRCKGPCLVYVRGETDVLSRPVPLSRPGRPSEFAGSLSVALAISDPELRKARIIAALELLAAPGADAEDFNWLHMAAGHLNGLPPSAFDALKWLPSVPAALIRLALKSDSEQRSVIWSLQNVLPFLWLSLPAAAWKTALHAEFETLVHLLTPIFGEEAVAKATAQLLLIRNELVSFDPGLEMTFALAGLPLPAPSPLSPLAELASAYVRGQFERNSDGVNDLAARLTQIGVAMPSELSGFAHTNFAGLFAPVVLAAAAQSKIPLSTDLALLARRTLREDPMYVSQAYRHLLKFYA